MCKQLHLAYDGDFNRAEIEISGSTSSLIELGLMFKEANGILTLKASKKETSLYPRSLSLLKLSLQEKGDDLLSIAIEGDALILSGTKKAFYKIGQSLANFFQEPLQEDDHFHIDYFEGSDLLASTDHSLIFTCA